MVLVQAFPVLQRHYFIPTRLDHIFSSFGQQVQ